MKKLLISALLLGACLLPNYSYAYSTLLFAGAQDIDYQSCTGTCSAVTTAATFRATWSKMSYTTTASTADPPTNSFITPTFANQTTVWVHFQYYNTNVVTTTNNAQLLCVYGSDGNPAVCIRGTGTNGQVKISTRNTSGTFSDLVTCSANTFPIIGLQQVDFQLTYGTSGSAAIWLNSVSVCTQSGDNTTNSRTQVNQVRLGGGVNSGGAINFSEVIVGTSDTTKLGVLDMYTNGNGNATAWSGTNVCTAIWAANAFSDGSFASTSSNNSIHQCTVNSTLPSGAFNVIATVQSARALVGATGPQHFEFNTRTGGTDYNSSDQTPTGSFGNFPNYIQTTNPAGGGWATTDLTAGTYNIGLKSTP
jgi:hypothetical protein